MRGSYALVIEGPIPSVPKLTRNKRQAIELFDNMLDMLSDGQSLRLLQGDFSISQTGHVKSFGKVFELAFEEELGEWPELPEGFESPVQLRQYVQGCALAVPKKYRRKAWLQARERGLAKLEYGEVNPFDQNYTIPPKGYRFRNGVECFSDFLFWEDYR
jgi:hypothetical protein